MKLLEVEGGGGGHVPQCPIAGDATDLHFTSNIVKRKLAYARHVLRVSGDIIQFQWLCVATDGTGARRMEPRWGPGDKEKPTTGYENNA